jgi:hypothetical protein
MNRMLDIFRLDDRGVLWLDAAETLELARSRVQELAVSSPGQYLVVDLATGNKHLIGSGDLEDCGQIATAKLANKETR